MLSHMKSLHCRVRCRSTSDLYRGAHHQPQFHQPNAIFSVRKLSSSTTKESNHDSVPTNTEVSSNQAKLKKNIEDDGYGHHFKAQPPQHWFWTSALSRFHETPAPGTLILVRHGKSMNLSICYSHDNSFSQVKVNGIIANYSLVGLMSTSPNAA